MNTFNKLVELKNEVNGYLEKSKKEVPLNLLKDLIEIVEEYHYNDEGRLIHLKMKQFVIERIDKLSKKFSSSAFICLHILPHKAFECNSSILDMQKVKNIGQYLRPFDLGGWNNFYNFDGFLIESDETTNTQLYRDGRIEVVSGRMFSHDTTIYPSQIEHQIIDQVKRCHSAFETFPIPFPFEVFITLGGIENYRFVLPSRFLLHNSRLIDRARISLPSITINKETTNIPMNLKPSLDILWNAAGLPNSPNFQEERYQPL